MAQRSLRAKVKRALLNLPSPHQEAAWSDFQRLESAIEIKASSLFALIMDPRAAADLRAIAVGVLALAGEVRARNKLRELLLLSAPVEVQWEAAKGLCDLGESDDFFIRVLSEGNTAEVRKMAAYALGRVGSASSTAALIAVLGESLEEPGLRGQVAESLGYIGDLSVVPELERAAVDSSSEVRFWAVFALGQLKPESSLPLLELIASSDTAKLEGWGTVSEEARLALEAIQAKRA
ncbi:MAG: HEAT repeat domain-containing protein [Thermoanaerobaculia bacterium]